MNGPLLASPEAAGVSTALHQRLLAAWPVLVAQPMVDLPPDIDAANAVLLDVLVDAVRADLRPARVWLLLVTVCGCYPSPSFVEDAIRTFELESTCECTVWILATAVPATRGRGAGRPMRLVHGGVLINVDHTAKNDLHTGVQRVIRETVPLLVADHAAIPVVWHADRTGFRTLDAVEASRVLAWGRPGAAAGDGDGEDVLLVPWEGVVAVVDVDQLPALEVLVSVARFSGSAVVGIGYDCIPVLSADLVPWGGAGLFARYLELVKHMRRVAAISASARTEFQGFVDMLPAQGLTGPVVTECLLPADAATSRATRPLADPPLITAVGSYEPRKNQIGLLHAAEVLWREGRRFRLQLIGGMSWDTEVRDRIAVLEEQGRPVVARHRIDEEALGVAYASSRFTVFASLHEGYGLPVAESLAAGTPVITSGYGSTAEIGADGGVVLVDPRRDDELVDAMRSLLTDDGRLSALEQQIAARSPRTWAQYAADLWVSTMAPELARGRS